MMSIMVSIMFKKCVLTQQLLYHGFYGNNNHYFENTQDKLQYFGWVKTNVWGYGISSNISKLRRGQSRSQTYNTPHTLRPH